MLFLLFVCWGGGGDFDELHDIFFFWWQLWSINLFSKHTNHGHSGTWRQLNQIQCFGQVSSFRFSIYFIDRIVNNLKSSQILKFYLFGNYKECFIFHPISINFFSLWNDWSDRSVVFVTRLLFLNWSKHDIGNIVLTVIYFYF